MIMLALSVVLMVSASFWRIFSSLIMVVLRCLSSPSVRLCFLANSVRLMYRAFSFVVSCLAVVVFPVHGVPVMRMTRLFMFFIEVERVVIGYAVFCEGLKTQIDCFLWFFVISGCFWLFVLGGVFVGWICLLMGFAYLSVGLASWCVAFVPFGE
jgi:hypothetical protein